VHTRPTPFVPAPPSPLDPPSRLLLRTPGQGPKEALRAGARGKFLAARTLEYRIRPRSDCPASGRLFSGGVVMATHTIVPTEACE
jgi:hypothetical protein